MKKCRKCGQEKPITEYYKHKEMFDGRVNACKECTKKRIRAHRINNIDRIREYDRNRPNKLSRSADLSKKKKINRACFPIKYKAQSAIQDAVKTRKIERAAKCYWCKVIGDRMEAHHEDYSKPLGVVWLCSPCHCILHRGIGVQAKKMREKIKIPMLE